MPQVLTDRVLRSLKPAADRIMNVRDAHPKSGGLELRIFPSGERRWAIRYRVGSRQRRLTLGDALVIPLGGKGGARELARNALKEVANGKDPVEAKREKRQADTVAEFAAVYMERHSKAHKRSWRNDRAILDADLLPKWKNRPMKEITRRDARELLEAIVDRGAPIHANRVRALGSKMWNFALSREVVDHNVFRDTLRPAKERVRERVLTPEEIRTFWLATETMPKPLRAMWRLRLLTAQRPQEEVAQIVWREIDLGSGWWTIPATKAKNGREHHVPLSAPAVELLRDIRPSKPEPDDFVFAGFTRHPDARKGTHLPIPDFQPRDLRKTARTLMAQDGVPDAWAEEVLNHKRPGIEGVYNLHKYDREKRQALDHLARRIDAIVKEQEGAKVLHFRSAV